MEDKELIIDWFEHIAQIADDRKTANGVVMTPEHALDEIKVIAKDAAYYVDKHLCEKFTYDSSGAFGSEWDPDSPNFRPD